MFRVARFDVEDVKPLLAEPMNAHLSAWVSDDYKYAKSLGERSVALTVLAGGVVMMCAFIVEIWKGRGYLVIVLSENIKEHPVSVYRGLKNFLKSLPYNRLEFDSPCGFTLGHRIAKFLGFELMCERARRYLQDGRDAAVYEWVRS